MCPGVETAPCVMFSVSTQPANTVASFFPRSAPFMTLLTSPGCSKLRTAYRLHRARLKPNQQTLLMGIVSMFLCFVRRCAGRETFRLPAKAISLNDVVDADAIEAMGILDDPEVQQRLLPLLPEGRHTEEELRESVSALAFPV